jgi:hypothetical protein
MRVRERERKVWRKGENRDKRAETEKGTEWHRCVASSPGVCLKVE